MTKTYLGKILRIQMFIVPYPPLFPHHNGSEKTNFLGQDSKDSSVNLTYLGPVYFPTIMDLKSTEKKIFTKFLEILSSSLHFDRLEPLFLVFSGHLGPK